MITQRVRTSAIPLREVQVRTVRPDEEQRWNELMRQHHYLGFRKLCGSRLRLFLVVNQSRFLLLSAAGQHPGLASRVLGQSLRQLPREWQRRHGAPL